MKKRKIRKSFTVNVVRDEKQPIGRLLIEELPEQRHDAARPAAPICTAPIRKSSTSRCSTPATESGFDLA